MTQEEKWPAEVSALVKHLHVFACVLNLGAKKCKYWIVNLLSNAEAGTGGSATATHSLSN